MLIASVAPRRPKRTAAQPKAGNTRYANGVALRNAISLIPATAISINIASTTRAGVQPRAHRPYQASASGITINAPAASPSHHVRATSGSSLLLITSPANSDSGPTVALIAVPAAIAPSRP